MSTAPGRRTLTIENGPVTMPPLPPRLVIRTEQQLKALADPVRSRMLVFLQHQPATAKQLANHFGVLPGSASHHLQVLEDAGLVQVVALRMVHGIVAKYYARAARIFVFEALSEVAGADSIDLNMLTEARDELTEALATNGSAVYLEGGFPHVRLSAERASFYKQRFTQLLEDLVNEPLDPDGQVYALSLAFFLAPATLQVSQTNVSDVSKNDGH